MKPASEAILNELLRKARVDKGWTQEEIAKMIGATPNDYSRWERGITFPSPYYRKKLSEVFGKSPEELGVVRQSTREKPSRAQVSSITHDTNTTDEEMRLIPVLGREQEIAVQPH